MTDPAKRSDPHIIEAWNAHFSEWCLARTKREIWAEARKARVLCGPLFTVQEFFDDDHFRTRGLWAQVQHPDLGIITIPGRPFLMERGGWELRRPAPRLGEHTIQVLQEAGVPEDSIAAMILDGVPA